MPLNEFTKRRNDLAKQLKAAGDLDGSAKVAALSKPSVAAWALNQVVREKSKTMKQLLEIDEALRNSHSRAELREGSSERKRIVGQIVQEASDVLEKSGSTAGPSVTNKVVQTLLAAGTSEDVRLALSRGRLVKDFHPGGIGDQMWESVEAPKKFEPRLVQTEEDAEAERRKALGEELDRLLKTVDELRQAAHAARLNADTARSHAEKAEADAKSAERKFRDAATAAERKRSEIDLLRSSRRS